MKPIIKEGQFENTHDDIAEAMHMTRSTVSETQRRALEKLRVELAKRGYSAKDFFGE